MAWKVLLYFIHTCYNLFSSGTKAQMTGKWNDFFFYRSWISLWLSVDASFIFWSLDFEIFNLIHNASNLKIKFQIRSVSCILRWVRHCWLQIVVIFVLRYKHFRALQAVCLKRTVLRNNTDTFSLGFLDILLWRNLLTSYEQKSSIGLNICVHGAKAIIDI